MNAYFIYLRAFVTLNSIRQMMQKLESWLKNDAKTVEKNFPYLEDKSNKVINHGPINETLDQ